MPEIAEAIERAIAELITIRRTADYYTSLAREYNDTRQVRRWGTIAIALATITAPNGVLATVAKWVREI